MIAADDERPGTLDTGIPYGRSDPRIEPSHRRGGIGGMPAGRLEYLSPFGDALAIREMRSKACSPQGIGSGDSTRVAPADTAAYTEDANGRTTSVVGDEPGHCIGLHALADS